MKFEEFLNYVKSVGGVDTDGYYGKQCMDLWNYYCREVLGITDNMGALYAKDILNNSNVAKYFKIVKNDPDYIPPKGAVANWQGFNYGHVGIVLEANINNFKCLEQNWSGKCELSETLHNYFDGTPLYFFEPYNRKNIDVPQNKRTHIHLPASVRTWRIYPLNKAPVVGNECGQLLPSKFGGLDYDVIRWVQENVAVIKTRDWGEVQIYVGADTDAIIS